MKVNVDMGWTWLDSTLVSTHITVQPIGGVAEFEMYKVWKSGASGAWLAKIVNVDEIHVLNSQQEAIAFCEKHFKEACRED